MVDLRAQVIRAGPGVNRLACRSAGQPLDLRADGGGFSLDGLAAVRLPEARRLGYFAFGPGRMVVHTGNVG
jgi:hypothetical protein